MSKGPRERMDTDYAESGEPHPLSEMVHELAASADIDQDLIDRICKGIEDLADQASR